MPAALDTPFWKVSVQRLWLSTGEVLRMTLEGYEADEIADTLGIKARSVVQTRWRITQKMKKKSRR